MFFWNQRNPNIFTLQNFPRIAGEAVETVILATGEKKTSEKESEFEGGQSDEFVVFFCLPLFWNSWHFNDKPDCFFVGWLSLNIMWSAVGSCVEVQHFNEVHFESRFQVIAGSLIPSTKLLLVGLPEKAMITQKTCMENRIVWDEWLMIYASYRLYLFVGSEWVLDCKDSQHVGVACFIDCNASFFDMDMFCHGIFSHFSQWLFDCWGWWFTFPGISPSDYISFYQGLPVSGWLLTNYNHQLGIGLMYLYGSKWLNLTIDLPAKTRYGINPKSNMSLEKKPF